MVSHRPFAQFNSVILETVADDPGPYRFLAIVQDLQDGKHLSLNILCLKTHLNDLYVT